VPFFISSNFSLTSTLSDISIVKLLICFQLLLAYIPFSILSFSVCVSLPVFVYYKVLHIIFLIQWTNLCFLIGELILFHLVFLLRGVCCFLWFCWLFSRLTQILFIVFFCYYSSLDFASFQGWTSLILS
jgi:hypothetical protein